MPHFFEVSTIPPLEIEVRPYAEQMRSAFSSMLAEARKAIGMNQKDFAIAVNSDKSTVGHYETGYTAPDLEVVSSWCDTLKLEGSERRRFLDLAALAHLPAAVRPRFESWYDEHVNLAQRYDEILHRLKRNRVADE
jgi:transcriptional regulator with XRE-family HTH domain